jgi:hypothetical protein
MKAVVNFMCIKLTTANLRTHEFVKYNIIICFNIHDDL